MMQIEKQREDYYRKLGTPPGVPTMKGATAEPENTHEGYNTIIKELGDHSVPDGWIQRPKRNAVPDTPPGPPLQWDKAEDPDDVQPGYGYVPADTTHEDIFYYHTDHLGSTSYITDAKANIAQFDAYLPYGELLVDEHSSTEEMPYKFNGKELDEETGLYYYGARYMDPKISMWLGVDPLAEKYPEISPYIYCHNNPINLIDPNGKNDYILNLDGEIKLIEENSNDFNTIFAYDRQGGIDKNTKIDVPKSFNESKTTTQVQGRTSKDADGNKISTYEFDLYTVDDEQIASNIFEFLAKNSDVEWSNTKVSSKDNTSFNLISTSHKEGSEVGMRYTFEKYKNNYNFTIDYAIHSHLPESVGFSPGDIKFAKDAKSIYPNIELKIYNRIEYKSFDQYDIPGVLNEVVVTPQKR